MNRFRQEELIALAKEHLSCLADSLFDYGYWDSLIECDELLTLGEFEWLCNNFSVSVTLEEENKEPE